MLNAKTDHKVITNVVQNENDFEWTQSLPNWTWSNKFSAGKECELDTMTGSKFKVSLAQKTTIHQTYYLKLS